MSGNVKVMVVDDELGVRESLNQILKIKNYEVFAFESGKEAVASMQTTKYDIAFVDWILKGSPGNVLENGVDVLKKIKEIDPSVEVIIITAYPQEEILSQAITHGAMEYLRKPFLMGEIYNYCDRALRKRREKGII